MKPGLGLALGVGVDLYLGRALNYPSLPGSPAAAAKNQFHSKHSSISPFLSDHLGALYIEIHHTDFYK